MDIFGYPFIRYLDMDMVCLDIHKSEISLLQSAVCMTAHFRNGSSAVFQLCGALLSSFHRHKSTYLSLATGDDGK